MGGPNYTHHCQDPGHCPHWAKPGWGRQPRLHQHHLLNHAMTSLAHISSWWPAKLTITNVDNSYICHVDACVDQHVNTHAKPHQREGDPPGVSQNKSYDLSFTNPPSGQWSDGQSIVVFSINATSNTPTMPTTMSYHHALNSITMHHLNCTPCQMPPLFHLCSSHPPSTKAAKAGPQLTPINQLLEAYVWIWTYNVEHMPNVMFSVWNCVRSWYSPTCMRPYLPCM